VSAPFEYLGIQICKGSHRNRCSGEVDCLALGLAHPVVEVPPANRLSRCCLGDLVNQTQQIIDSIDHFGQFGDYGHIGMQFLKSAYVKEALSNKLK
jgi:hypothetical protein